MLTVDNDVCCRKAVENVLHQMLLSDHVGYSLVAHLLPCLRSLHSSTNSLVTYLAETVAEIRQPITTVEKGVSAEEHRKIDVQVRICSASVLCPLQFVNVHCSLSVSRYCKMYLLHSVISLLVAKVHVELNQVYVLQVAKVCVELNQVCALQVAKVWS